MLKLITFPPAFGAPSASPFGVKVMCLLQMAGVEWEQGKGGDPSKAPKGKLPMLIDGEVKIPDSESIRSHLEHKFEVDFDKGLTVEQRATSRAVIRMVEEHLYFAAACNRWMEEENWEIMRETFFGIVPKPVRKLIANKVRAKMVAGLKAQGMGRHSAAERFERAEKDISAIRELLADKQFLFGESPSAADASAAPMLEAISNAPKACELNQRVTEDAKLMAYITRVRKAIYPV